MTSSESRLLTLPKVFETRHALMATRENERYDRSQKICINGRIICHLTHQSPSNDRNDDQAKL